jgi:hypothetical protein
MSTSLQFVVGFDELKFLTPNWSYLERFCTIDATHCALVVQMISGTGASSSIFKN